MLPDRVSNPGPLTYESGVLPIALFGPAEKTYVTLDKETILKWELHVLSKERICSLNLQLFSK